MTSPVALHQQKHRTNICIFKKTKCRRNGRMVRKIDARQLDVDGIKKGVFCLDSN